MDLTSVVSGGQWLLPTIIVLLIGAGLYQYADRKNLTNLKKVLDYLSVSYTHLRAHETS